MTDYRPEWTPFHALNALPRGAQVTDATGRTWTKGDRSWHTKEWGFGARKAPGENWRYLGELLPRCGPLVPVLPQHQHAVLRSEYEWHLTRVHEISRAMGSLEDTIEVWDSFESTTAPRLEVLP